MTSAKRFSDAAAPAGAKDTTARRKARKASNFFKSSCIRPASSGAWAELPQHRSKRRWPQGDPPIQQHDKTGCADSWSAASRSPALEAYADALGGLNEGTFYQSSMLLICDRLGQWR